MQKLKVYTYIAKLGQVATMVTGYSMHTFVDWCIAVTIVADSVIRSARFFYRKVHEVRYWMMYLTKNVYTEYLLQTIHSTLYNLLISVSFLFIICYSGATKNDESFPPF